MSDSTQSPEKQLAEFIAKYDAPIQKLVRAARAKMRQRIPGAVELIYDNYNTLAIGYGPNEQTSKAIISLAVYPRWVNLYFLHGASLRDPTGVLQGAGRQGRFVRLECATDIDLPEISTIIDSAVNLSTVPFTQKKGYTLIKSVSEQQRPRSGSVKK